MEATANETTYLGADHLGSARMEFAAPGWPVWSEDYAPYGQEVDAQPTSNIHKFTGYERDPETGDDYAQARFYSSQIQGRFMSPDPYMGSMNLANPQSLNRYAYVMNNPVRFIDPSGLILCDYGADENGNEAYEDEDTDNDCTSAGGDVVDVSQSANVTATADPPIELIIFYAADILETSDPTGGSSSMLDYLKSCEGHAPNGGYGAYNDSRGYCTTGYGQLLHLSACTAQDISTHSSETESQASGQLQVNYNDAQQWVAANTSGLNAGQQNTIVDLDFNMGPTRLQTHTVWRDIESGNLDSVPADIMSLKAGGNGIPTRRSNEVTMWNGGSVPEACYP